jgi:hypothetical protein
MGYEIRNNIKKGYFRLGKVNKSNESIEYLLDKHKIDIKDYWVLKATNKFKLIDKCEYEKYASIIFLNKSLFNGEYINNFLDKIYNDLDLMIVFFNKPIPYGILNKIKIVQWDI